MPPRSRLFVSDEELGKRDDDHKPSKTSVWLSSARANMPWKRRRLAGFIVACLLIYVFVQNIPTDLRPVDRGRSRAYSNIAAGEPPDPKVIRDQQKGLGFDAGGAQVRPGSSLPPPVDGKYSNAPAQNYEGGIRFYYLAATLHRIARGIMSVEFNKNIMFAASDLGSAAVIIPLACEMARWRRNSVHMVIMGRDDLPLDDIMNINNVQQSCGVQWHDARPDYAIYSSDKRMEASVAGALDHIQEYMHPQAIITAGSGGEDDFFTRGMRRKAKKLDLTLISIPATDPDKFSWMTRLEANALRAWHTATIDIVVQAPPGASGSIIRLLRSLEKADYAGFIPPRLTIELPHKIDSATQTCLNKFQWPPEKYLSHYSHGQNNQLILRRRIPERKVHADEAALRFIESFYPANAEGSHVLVLSPQAELSPIFFHYLKYHLLEYRYSSFSLRDSDNIIGISLESPSMHLNGTTEFELPESRAPRDNEVLSTPFLWQAPNSNAALYFSDKWMEIHAFLTKRQRASVHKLTHTSHLNRRKLISPKQPQWTEYFLDLMRARGYLFLYPSPPSKSSELYGKSLVIVHNELYHPPEEFTHPQPTGSSSSPGSEGKLPAADAILEVDTSYLASKPSDGSSHKDNLNVELPLLQNLVPLLPAAPSSSLPFDEFSLDAAPVSLPDPLSLLVLDHAGTETTLTEMDENSDELAVEYRKAAGGCSDFQARNGKEIFPGSADDLFCIPDDDYEEDDTADSTSEHEGDAKTSKEPSQLKEDSHADDEDTASSSPKPEPKLRRNAGPQAGHAGRILGFGSGGVEDETAARNTVHNAAAAAAAAEYGVDQQEEEVKATENAAPLPIQAKLGRIKGWDEGGIDELTGKTLAESQSTTKQET